MTALLQCDGCLRVVSANAAVDPTEGWVALQFNPGIGGFAHLLPTITMGVDPMGDDEATPDVELSVSARISEPAEVIVERI